MNDLGKSRGLMLLRIVICIVSVAFLFNFAWEMLQMKFYAGMNLSDAKDWYLCFRATFGDVMVTLFIYVLGKTIFRQWRWPLEFNLLKIIYVEIVGLAFALYFEIVALHTGEWSYSRLMPRLPLLDVGAVPLIQMMLLPALSCRVGLRISQYFNR